jgi:hypothetical protein
MIVLASRFQFSCRPASSFFQFWCSDSSFCSLSLSLIVRAALMRQPHERRGSPPLIKTERHRIGFLHSRSCFAVLVVEVRGGRKEQEEELNRGNGKVRKQSAGGQWPRQTARLQQHAGSSGATTDLSVSSPLTEWMLTHECRDAGGGGNDFSGGRSLLLSLMLKH